MTRPAFRLLPLAVLLPLLAGCAVVDPISEVDASATAPVFGAPEPLPEPVPAPEPSTAAIAAEIAPPEGPDFSAAVVAAEGAPGLITLPPAVVAALPPGTPPALVFQNTDGCYLFSVEQTVPRSGYPVRNADGAPICEGDDGTVAAAPTPVPAG